MSPTTSADSPFELDAKEAYSVFQHRTGAQAAYEQLSQREKQAWRETVEHIEQYGKCECGEELMCPACDQEEPTPRPIPRERPTTRAKARIKELEAEVETLRKQIDCFDKAIEQRQAIQKRRARSKA